MIRTTLILLLSLFISTSAIAGHKMHCDLCCKKCKKHEKHMCRVQCKGHAKNYGYGKRGGHWRMGKEHRNCCATFAGAYDHHCGFCYEANRGYDNRRVDQGIAASYGCCGTCRDGNAGSYRRKFDMDDNRYDDNGSRRRGGDGQNYRRKRYSYDYSYKSRSTNNDHADYDNDVDNSDVRRDNLRSGEHRGYASRGY